VAKLHSRLDSVLLFFQRRSFNKGVFKASRIWLAIGVTSWVLRLLRRVVVGEYELVYRGTVQPGEVLQISHSPETYTGKRVRSRRRKVRG
jgi:hypothetical protein